MCPLWFEVCVNKNWLRYYYCNSHIKRIKMIYGIFGINVTVCLFLLVSYYWFHFDSRYATRSIYFYNYLFVLFENNSLTLSETAWVIVRTFNMLFSFSLALHFVRKLFIILFLYQISICIITGIICNGTV